MYVCVRVCVSMSCASQWYSHRFLWCPMTDIEGTVVHCTCTVSFLQHTHSLPHNIKSIHFKAHLCHISKAALKYDICMYYTLALTKIINMF